MTVFRCLAPGALLVAMAVAVSGQTVPANTLGLYTVADTAPGENQTYEGAPGVVVLYAVLSNPWNPRLDAPMAAVGGFAFRIALPTGVFLLGATLPDGTGATNGPDFVLTEATAPVMNGACVLVTLTIGAFSSQESYLYLAPTSDTAPLPGTFAVFDADDPEADCPLVPASGSCDDPVFAFWPEGSGCPPVQAVSWSAAAALFR